MCQKNIGWVRDFDLEGSSFYCDSCASELVDTASICEHGYMDAAECYMRECRESAALIAMEKE